MPTLMVEDLSLQLYETLVQRASAAQRSVSDEAKRILADGLNVSDELVGGCRVPDLIISEEFPPPCDLPRPGCPQDSLCREGEQRLPDPLPDLVGNVQ